MAMFADTKKNTAVRKDSTASTTLTKTRENMKNRSKQLSKLSVLKDQRGLSTVEYVIILTLIAVAGIALWRTFGGELGKKIENSTKEVQKL